MIARAAWTLLIFTLSVGLVLAWAFLPPLAALALLFPLIGAMIARYRAGTAHRDPGRCRTCDYDLTGLEEALICPECGEPFPPRWDLEAVLREHGRASG